MKELLIKREMIKKRLFEMSDYTRHKGMVGWLKREDCLPEYIYGEITGYFLSFCVYLYDNTDNIIEKDKLKKIIKSHVQWLNICIDNDIQTRYMLSEKEEWRNEAQFSFDFGMIIRGLEDVKKIVPTQSVINKYLLKFSVFIDETKCLIPVFYKDEKKLPIKWSTSFDIHLMKVAANLYGISGWDNEISINIYNSLINLSFEDILKRDSHPIMYYMEGILLFNTKKFERSKNALKKITKYYLKILQSDEVITNNFYRKQYIRSDVLAQAVRVGCILHILGEITEVEFGKVKSLLEYLLNQFYEEGYICYTERNDSPNFYNTWCEMFSYQAIDFFLKVCKYKEECKNIELLGKYLF